MKQCAIMHGPIYTRDTDRPLDVGRPSHSLTSIRNASHIDVHRGADEDWLFPQGHCDIASWLIQKMNLWPSGYRTVELQGQHACC